MVTNATEYNNCPKCGEKHIKFYTKESLLKESLLGFSITFLLLFVSIVLYISGSNIYLYFALAGVFALVWSFLRYGKYAGLKQMHLVCKKCGESFQKLTF